MDASKDQDEPSYIDYETFLSPDFSAPTFANSLVLATNNPTDTPLDLSTPLSRVLFDIQEIDSHIDLLTTRSAVPLLEHTRDQTNSSGAIVSQLDGQIKAVNDSYRQLEKEIIQTHTEAEEVRLVATRLCETLRLGRAVARCLQLGRQLEVQHAEVSPAAVSTGSVASIVASRRDTNHRALVRCSETILALRELLSTSTVPGGEGFGVDRVVAVRTLQASVLDPTERSVRETAEKLVREFSVGGNLTFAQADEARARSVSALHTLYLLSPVPAANTTKKGAGETHQQAKWTPTLMLQSLEAYLRSAIQSSIAGLARGLAALPSLERALAEVAARCQNVVALEAVLEGAKAPVHPLLSDAPQRKGSIVGTGSEKEGNLLQPLLAYLETGSLASYFWRSLAPSLATRVTEIVNRGGVSARTLKTNRTSVGDAIRECVVKGSQLPSSVAATKGGRSRGAESEKAAPSWDREVAVMVGSVVGNLGR
jgi:hypothetical protein